jgi:hypothetical protein
MLLQGQEAELSNRQAAFAQDILSSYQLLQQLKKWEQEYQSKKGLL